MSAPLIGAMLGLAGELVPLARDLSAGVIDAVEARQLLARALQDHLVQLQEIDGQLLANDRAADAAAAELPDLAALPLPPPPPPAPPDWLKRIRACQDVAELGAVRDEINRERAAGKELGASEQDLRTALTEVVTRLFAVGQ